MVAQPIEKLAVEGTALDRVEVARRHRPAGEREVQGGDEEHARRVERRARPPRRELGADRDRKRKLVPYGDALLPEDRKQIPESDMPPGTPAWMRSLKQWATRKGATPDAKRATVEVKVPTGERPWK